jgi:hypothetical protein
MADTYISQHSQRGQHYGLQLSGSLADNEDHSATETDSAGTDCNCQYNCHEPSVSSQHGQHCGLQLLAVRQCEEQVKVKSHGRVKG